MLIDIHLLQNHAPSNLNRDDTGSPKDAVFGGFTRARISSQCLKRSIRRSAVFREAFGPAGLLSDRTQRLPGLLREELERQGAEPAAVNAIVKRAPEIGRESTKVREAGDGDGADEAMGDGMEQGTAGDGQTAQLIFLAQGEVSRMAEGLLRLYREKGEKNFGRAKVDEITRALGTSVPRSVDIAMFGRMTTSAAFEDVQAAVQVAHALSTHRIEQEFDYYTAVDDISGQSGAGFIGDTAFNSATYYKYFSVHWEGLVKNLGGDEAVAGQAVRALIEAAATAQPSGKQNSFAAHNLPDVVLVEVRERNLPVSYANAFLKPVRAAGSQSLMDASAQALGDYMGRAIRGYGLSAQRAQFGLGDYDLPESGRVASLAELLEWLPLPGAPIEARA